QVLNLVIDVFAQKLNLCVENRILQTNTEVFGDAVLSAHAVEDIHTVVVQFLGLTREGRILRRDFIVPASHTQTTYQSKTIGNRQNALQANFEGRGLDFIGNRVAKIIDKAIISLTVSHVGHFECEVFIELKCTSQAQ